MANLQTKIGLEIHVQLKTKSKMFCGCDNNAEKKAPNSVVCPVCLALPGALPVANKQAILWTIKTGLALNCDIPKIAKFDRKHYFYPDLPKGYQISQYDEPFCVGGYVEVDGRKIRLNRIHLEEDAGKLIHRGNKSYVDLNRAGTPLMEIVTEPDIVSPKEAGEFLRKLQKIVRDVVGVSEASMEKGHMRCDANISVNDGDKMSQIIELKNLNSFKFVEKALALVEIKLNDEYAQWPIKGSKETWGYDSENNKVYLQRRKEEAADYRYFPEPDLPPFDTTEFDLDLLRAEISQDEEEKIKALTKLGIVESDAKVLVADKVKSKFFESIGEHLEEEKLSLLAKTIVQKYYSFDLTENDFAISGDYAKAVSALSDGKLSKSQFSELALGMHKEERNFESFIEDFNNGSSDVEMIVCNAIKLWPNEVNRYKSGEKQLFGFFVGQIMKTTGGKVNPQEVTKILREKLEG